MGSDRKSVTAAASTTSDDAVIETDVDVDGDSDFDRTEVFNQGSDTDEHEPTSDGSSFGGGDDLGFDDAPVADVDKTRAVMHLIRPPLESPNSQIRLLWLHPGGPNNAIHVTVSTWNLAKAPAFSAISYTWGPPEPEAFIYLCDLDESNLSPQRFTVKVRGNARYALWQVRLHRPGTFVWMDSVCIDQDNLTEKGAQVAIMGEIYKRARRVFACIGPSDQSSDAVEAALRDLDGTIQEVPDDLDDRWSYQYPLAHWDPLQDEEIFIEFLAHWDEFSKRAFFHRLWIVQELHGGRGRSILLCGKHTLSWARLMDLQIRLTNWVHHFQDVMRSEHEVSTSIHGLHHLIYASRTERGTPVEEFQFLLENSGNLLCEQRRDHVYGILGIIDWDGLGLAKPVPCYDTSLFDLALSLLPPRRAKELYLAKVIVQVLGLRHSMEMEPARWLDFVRTHEKDRNTPKTDSWYSTMYGICRVQRDGRARLSLDLKRDYAQQERDVQLFNLLQSYPETMGDTPLPFEGSCTPIPLYTDDEVSALAWPSVHEEDLILHTFDFNVVLRRSDVLGQYRVVGKVVFVKGYRTKARRGWTCDCWDKAKGYTDEFLCVAISRVSNLDVLLQTALNGWICPTDDVLRLSLDFPPLGSIVRSYTDRPRRPDQLVRPLKTSCTMHDAAMCNRWRDNNLEFAILSGCGPYVQVNR